MSSVFEWRNRPCAISAEFITRGKVQENSTAMVQRRREEGQDLSTILGLSKKADAMRVPHGGAYTRAIPTGGRRYEPEGKAGKIRKLLESGPMTRKQISDQTGWNVKALSGIVKNDIRNGRILEIREKGQKIVFVLAAS